MSGAADPHAAYLAACPAPARERLLAIRAVWEASIAGTMRCMSYHKPALRHLPKGARPGRMIAYFATFKAHIGIYPPVTGPPDLLAQLAPYAGPRGNLIFPHAQDLPLELIERVGVALAGQAGANNRP